MLVVTSVTSWSQTHSISNSFDSTYKKTNPTLNYKYDDVNQIHDYSNNWVFDLDGQKDELLFIGTGGAHLYYYLRIILSSDKQVRDYTFIELDFPLLINGKLKTTGQFEVLDSDEDGINDILLRLDNQTLMANSKQLRKCGINSKDILITFKKRKIKFNNYTP